MANTESITERLEKEAGKLTKNICKPAGCRFFKFEGQAGGFTIIFPSGCTIRVAPPIIDAFQQGSRGCEYYQDKQGNKGLLTPDGQVVRPPGI
jgi:hypothetical protein